MGVPCLPAFCLFLGKFLGLFSRSEIGLGDSGAFYLCRGILGGTCWEVEEGGFGWKYGFPASKWRNGFPGQFTFVNFMCFFLFCPHLPHFRLSASSEVKWEGQMPPYAAAKTETNFEPMGRGGRCGEGASLREGPREGLQRG